MPQDGRPISPLPRQRWRIVFRRDEDARFLAHLDAMKQWERALRRAGVPVAQTEGYSPRPRVVFAAPLPLGMLAEAEIVDMVLSERLTVFDLRRRLQENLPHGFALVDLYDVWLHAPSVASQLTGATYRIDLAAPVDVSVTSTALQGALDRLLAAERLDRRRQKEKKVVAYDLRPLIVTLDVVTWDATGGAGSGAGTVRVTLRHSQDEGTGRPDEIVAAISEAIPAELAVVQAVRERLILADDPASSS